MMMQDIPKPARTIAAVIVLIGVLLYANGIVGRYRTLARQANTAEAVAPPVTKPTQKAQDKAPAENNETPQEDQQTADTKPSGPTVVIKVDGLNFRQEPKKGAEVIRGLDAGERLSVLKTEGGWYYAEDSSGQKGWLYASDQYSTYDE